MNRAQRLSHDSIYNTYELAFNLQLQDRKGELKDFISQINLHPRIIVHFKATPLLETLDNILHIAHHPVSIHYDTVFNIGDYYLSTLTFQNYFFVQNPIVPFGFMIHSRRFHSDHRLLFLESIIEWVPSLSKKQVNIITDQESNFLICFQLVHIYFVGII